MIRLVACLCVCALGCGRSHGVSDQDLGNLVIEPKPAETVIKPSRAASDPAELGRALSLPLPKVMKVLGPHTVAMTSQTRVEEAGKPTAELGEQTTIELGEGATFHAVYTNTADYGREATFVATSANKIYLRPRYQRWHGRAPETVNEPADVRDSFYAPIAATWELFAPRAELIDQGNADVAGRAGKKIEVTLAPKPGANPPERLAQRKWRELRTIEALAGEVVLDSESGVPLSVNLAGTISFMRDGRRFKMSVTLTSTVSSIGKAAVIAAPPDADVVATPERMREVDDRDYLLQGIAPPLRKNPDGTIVPPAPKTGAP